MPIMRQISKKARIGCKVKIGPFTIIHDNVVIEDNTVIESHCVIGYPTPLAGNKPLVIGHGSHIRSHSIFYEGSCFGAELSTGHAVIVRENCTAGEGLQIGTHADIQGDCRIGDYVKTHSEVHIAKESTIGNFVYLSPRVQFTNDPYPPSFVCEGITIKDMTVVATGALLLPGITIGLGCFVGAGSVVRTDLPDLHCAQGNPARVFARVDQFFNPKHKLAFPWIHNFRKKYPLKSYPLMQETLEQIYTRLEQIKRSVTCRKCHSLT